ncbi:LOW QUALITY PROTEIN: hypothetical protein BKA57DRAFT_480350 [Linnemannia elongata]|nr:LOW QUALITY PROTEIN: hypothetical protein BKA57DRAFT_480350 [Linnemannia elongata]
MASILPVLRKRYLVLHDIDMTHDCRYVSTRTYLEMHLKAKGISTIVNDRGHNAQKIRYKFYNKLVQMLESADVRKSLHPLAVYQDRMDDARRLLDGCTTFDYSYEQQWIERAELIKAMVAVYIPGSKVFAYCHWWSSTNRQEVRLYVVQGFSAACHAPGCQLLVQRPSHLLCGGQKWYSGGHQGEDLRERAGLQGQNVVPGGSKGMFPSYALFDRESAPKARNDMKCKLVQE